MRQKCFFTAKQVNALVPHVVMIRTKVRAIAVISTAILAVHVHNMVIDRRGEAARNDTWQFAQPVDVGVFLLCRWTAGLRLHTLVLNPAFVPAWLVALLFHR